MAFKKRFFKTKTRTRLSFFFGLLALVLAVTTRSNWLSQGWLPLILGWIGLFLVIGGIFGRLLSTLFIGGRKSHELITDGPFGITRNPLYLFSFIALVGLGIASTNPAVLLLLVLGFAIYYPGVLAREEDKLANFHGPAYTTYQRQVPRFWPRLGRGWQEPEWVEASPHRFRLALADAFWFVAAYVALRAIAEAHARGALPAYPLPCC